MDNKQYPGPKVIVPICIGIIIGLVLFVLGDLDDAPGLSLIGLVLGSGLIFWGLFRIKVVMQKIDPGIAVPLFYCIGGIILAIVLELDGEISGFQRIVFIAALICAGLVSVTTIMLIRKRKNQVPA